MRILVREPIAEAGVALLQERFDVDVDPDSPLEEVIDRYDGIVIRSATRVTSELIDRASRLKVIGRAGVGVDNVDVDAATRRGIVVANAPESTVVSAAEQTIGLIVALARNVPQAHAALKAGRWERSRWGGIELAGKALRTAVSPLTPRERDVLAAAEDGATVADIAGRLHLSASTVRNYLSDAIGKTATRNRTEAALLARRNGWL